MEGFTVHAGTLEGEQRGLLRLEAPVAGQAVTVVLVPCPEAEEPPVCERTEDGLVVRWRGKQWRLARQPEAVLLAGRSFSL